MADALSRCLEFTCSEGGTTAAGKVNLLKKEQLMVVDVMQIEDGVFDSISIGAMELDFVFPTAKGSINETVFLDEE